MKAGRFRQDLYFRLNGATLSIPPLRERVDEIEPLALALVRDAALRAKKTPPMLSPEALRHLRAYPWPGNIRELRNTLERAVVLAGDRPLQVEHLPLEPRLLPAEPPAPVASSSQDEQSALQERLDTLERERIVDALARCSGNQTRAARLLGISRGTLIARLDSYGISRPRKPSAL
jgi:DNA-binding NtrC family response regulator